MTPAEAKQLKTYIEIHHPYGGKRYPAHIFDLPQGIAWIEYGWADDDPLSTPSNPVHMVQGKVEHTSEGQWQIQSEDGLVTIRTLRLSDDDGPERRRHHYEADRLSRRATESKPVAI